ncbi:MAG: elongation factor Ts [Candidatus Komeilibacteria bacterium]|nr:elongation factor Ts [Candidatus Komeilibacteria bacterium]
MDLALIKSIREKTGSGMVDVQKALEEAHGDETKALEILRKKGQAKAISKQERVTKEGRIFTYVHASGKVASVVSLAATSPLYLSADKVPQELVEKEREVYVDLLKQEGKPEAIWPKIIEGKLEKFFAEVCLLNQLYVKDDSKIIETLIQEAIMKLGENIKIVQFSRIQL